ncbi:MAG: hypothetical protein OJF50_004807 [Nitrospira sp.]|nr:hypothetical protein [Nitrospira sp.]
MGMTHFSTVIRRSLEPNATIFAIDSVVDESSHACGAGI